MVVLLAIAAVAVSSGTARADVLSPVEEHAADATLRQWMVKTGAPSVSIQRILRNVASASPSVMRKT